VLQKVLNPTGPAIQRYGWTFRVGDKVMQIRDDYDKGVFNGDIGRVAKIDVVEQEMTVRFDSRQVKYDFNELDELHLSRATTVHKSQGSEYPVVVLPNHTQHCLMLQRNLLYAAVTRLLPSRCPAATFSSMTRTPWHFLAVAISGWRNREQQSDRLAPEE
jgi:exodeoxyribonuclease V alpha subunit